MQAKGAITLICRVDSTSWLVDFVSAAMIEYLTYYLFPEIEYLTYYLFLEIST